jgi:hypothetical protein
MVGMHELPRTPWQRAASVASSQRGLLTAAQGRAAGLSDDEIERATGTRGWIRAARGLYLLPGSSPSWERDALAAVLLAGADAVAAVLTAAALWRWCRAPLLPHVMVPPAKSHRSPLGKVHRSPLTPFDRTVRDGIPCTSASRTLVDCAAVVERSRLELFVDDALCAGVASTVSIENAIARSGRRGFAGRRLLLDVLEVWTEEIEPGSPAEVRMIRQLLTLGAPAVESQHVVCDEVGSFVARLDAAVPAWRHGFEYDSDHHHNPRRWQRDEARYARLRALGWTVTPVSKLDLLPSSTWLADSVAATRAATVGTSP